jgi:hypothetical protein
VARGAHRALHLGFGLVLILLLVLAAAGWRLARGPVEVPFLAAAIERAANAETAGASRLEVGTAAIGWEGWREGRLSPVEIRLSGVRLRDGAGATRVELPDAALTLSLPWLLRGELAPRVLELRGPELRLARGADGEVRLALDLPPGPAEAAAPTDSPLDEFMAELLRPPNDATPRGALEALRISGGRVTVEDQALGRSWALEEAGFELRRLPAGGVGGGGTAVLRLGEAAVPAVFTLSLAGSPARISVGLTLPEVAPAVLARAAPPLAPLAAFDGAVRAELSAGLEADGAPLSVALRLVAGPGVADLGGGRRVATAGAELRARYAPGRLEVEQAVARLPGPRPVVLTGRGEATLAEGRWRGTAELELDAVRFADLGRHWPEGLGSGERDWILANITAGEARNGRWRFAGEAAEDFSSARLTALSGTLDVADATVHWLRPIPPVERAGGTVAFSLAEIAIRVASARQSGTGVVARDAALRFLFPERGPSQADLAIPLAGPLPDVLAVLQHPRLRLFERRPLPLKDPAGTIEGRLNLGFPLLDALPVEQLRLRAQARAREVRIDDILAGRPLERGTLELAADNDGLRISGTATVAEIAARVGVEMDFRSGPPNGVVMRETAQARTDARNLAAFGLETEEVLRGPVALDVRSERRRNGTGRVTVRADLREAAMALEPAGWSKPPGQNAGAEAVLRLSGDALEAVESFRVEAPSLSLRGTVAFGPGTRLQRVTLSDGVLEASRFGGEIRPPPRPGAPWAVVLRGPVLDLRRALPEESGPPPPAQPAASGPPYAIDARFDRVLLGPDRQLSAVEALVLLDGRGVVQDGRLAGRAGPRGGFEAGIAPAGQGRSLRVTAEDAGALLGAFGVLRHLEGGRLVLTGSYAHNGPGAPLSGVAEMSEFAVRNAPGFAKLLQAMTLYGVVEALAGPGLGFSRLHAPFTLTPEVLTLGESRAFSASLGLTARGTLDRRRQRLAMEGTIVPAYVFNALLGNIPIFGRLFSPEAGGGVFAATFRLTGPVDDPQVSVNPLAALTPGFLRGLFGIGQQQ